MKPTPEMTALQAQIEALEIDTREYAREIDPQVNLSMFLTILKAIESDLEVIRITAVPEQAVAKAQKGE